MNHIFVLLLNVVNREKRDSANYVIAKYLIEHINELDCLSTETLAKQCHVSKASISRFCKSIGLEDFLSLQLLVKAYQPDLDQKYYYSRSTNDYINDYMKELNSKIDAMLQQIDRNVLKQLIDDIKNYSNVILMGHMQSANIALNLQYDLLPLNKLVDCMQDVVLQKETLLHSSSDTLIIVFSSRGDFFKTVLSRENLMKNKSAKIYLITTNHVRKKDYIDTIISLDNEYNYVSSTLLLQLYANLIVLGLKDVS